MKLTVTDVDAVIDLALTRTGLATLMIWSVAGAIWWQALA